MFIKGIITFGIWIYSIQLVAGDSTQVYHWLREDLAYIQFHDRLAVKNLSVNWKNNSRYVVAHFGDSHVQPDIITAQLRLKLQTIKGDGGRGMVFPYAAARTHSAFDYSTRYTGHWQYARNTDPTPRLPLGLTGATIRTTDPNSTFSINFRDSLSSSSRKLVIYCRNTDASFDLEIKSGDHYMTIDVNNLENQNDEVIVMLPEVTKAIQVKVKKNEENQKEFELYGISIENINSNGALVHSLGIGGAPYSSLLTESLLENQLTSVNPDLVILDLGTNDYIPGNRIPIDMEIKIVDVIRKIRRAAPQSDILLTTTQDMNRKGINMSAGRNFSALIRSIAEKEKCAFFDWYWVAGGPKTMQFWVANGLAQRDNIHLTAAGYSLKGKLLTNAFFNTIEKLEKEPDRNSLILHEDSIPLPLQKLRDSLRRIPEPPVSYQRMNSDEISGSKIIFHLIRTGETLGTIAEKYGVTIPSLKDLNGIYGSKIIAGKKLKIPVKKEVPGINKNESKPKSLTVPEINTKQHIIGTGETLFSIAEKYKVTVDELKKLNGLKSSKIIAGEKLIIPITVQEEKRNKS